MVNLTHPELAELTPTAFPPASEESLWDLRSKACSSTQGGFTLQPHQRFLRRVLSPDSPTRSVLVVHGTGTGKTCTAIHVAEEYILRPEFQDQKVMIVASAAVQENFRDQLFDMSRVKVTDAGLLESKQCTGRRYLEMLQRIEQDPKNWANPEVRDRLEQTADRIISEFYEFTAYASFGNRINEMEALGKAKFNEWVHKTFDNRILILDEAHNIRPTEDVKTAKGITKAMEQIVKIADGLVLVLLTATPMYESYEEMLLYFNLFLWNERRQPLTKTLVASDFFDDQANLKEGDARTTFLGYCQDYVSYVKGENPFTFPFRLPPPKSVSPAPLKAWAGELSPLRYLTLVDTPTSGIQAAVLQKERRKDDDKKRTLLMQPTLAVLPDNAEFSEAFRLQGEQYAYTGTPFLGPETLANHSAKFARVLKSIETGEGIVFVYSNFVGMGAMLFAMALEEHGYTSVTGRDLLANPGYTGPRTKGAYALLTSNSSEKAIAKLVSQARNETNRDGTKIRVIISSPLVAEGVDFRCVRQTHILDPWWNMSRIEQIIGRSLRTCSHTLLPNEKQNCTVYLHTVRTPSGKECYDEYTYRTKVEPKAEKIARVRSILERAAMDCPLQANLPEDWKALPVSQQQSEGRTSVTHQLGSMLAPSFLDDAPEECIRVHPDTEDPDHSRPLSAILDVRDELLDKLGRLLLDKPIWDKDQLLTALAPYTRDVSLYTLQQAIDTGVRFRDAFNRPSILESKGELYALTPLEAQSGTLVDRTMKRVPRGRTDLPAVSKAAPVEAAVAPTLLATKRAQFKIPGADQTRFSEEVLAGYVFDHLLTDAEKRAYLAANPETLPFEDRIRVPGTEIVVMGHESYEPDEIPVGAEKTRVDEWKAALATKFSDIIAKKTIFASLTSGGNFTVSRLKLQDGKVVRSYEAAGKTPKTFGPTVCGTGANTKEVMTAFAKQVDSKGVGVPADVTSSADICVYAELLAREQHACAWLTPQELSVLYDDPTLRKRFAAEFKKTNPG